MKTEHMHAEAIYIWATLTFDRLLIWKSEPPVPSNPKKASSIHWPTFIGVNDTTTQPPEGNNQVKVGS